MLRMKVNSKKFFACLDFFKNIYKKRPDENTTDRLNLKT